MAKLVMTVDSDSEVDQAVKGQKKTKGQKVPKSTGDDEILLSANVVLGDSKAESGSR